MIPGGSITNRSELGVNIQKNPGLIQKNGQEIFQNEQYASCQPHFRIGLPRFRSSRPVSEWHPAAGGFSGRCLRLSRRLQFPRLRPGSRLWEGFRKCLRLSRRLQPPRFAPSRLRERHCPSHRIPLVPARRSDPPRIAQQDGQQRYRTENPRIVEIAHDLQRREGGQTGSHEHLRPVG